MKPVAGDVEILGLWDVAQVGKSEPNSFGLVWLDSACVTALVEALQTGVGEPLDRDSLYRVAVRRATGS